MKNSEFSFKPGDIIMGLLAFLAMLFVEPAKSLDRLVYGSRQYDRTIGKTPGVLAGLAAAIEVGTHTAVLPAAAATCPPFVAGVVAFLLVYFYIWPLANLIFIQSSCKLWNLVDDSIGWWFFWPFFSSRYSRYSWVSYVLMTVAVTATLVGIPTMWWDVFVGASHAITQAGNHVLGQGVCHSVSPVLNHVVPQGVQQFGAMAMDVVAKVFGGAVAVVAVVIYELLALCFLCLGGTGFISLALGIFLAGLIMPHASAGEICLFVVAFCGYIFPLVHTVFSHGFNFVATGSKRVMAVAYGEAKLDYQKSFAVLVAMLVAGVVGAIVTGALMAFGWSYAASLVGGSVFAVLLALKGGKTMQSNQAEELSVYVSIVVGMAVYAVYLQAHLAFGQYGAIISGSFAAVSSYFLFSPALYAGALKVAGCLKLDVVTSQLVKAHAITVKKYDEAMSALNEVKRSVYADAAEKAKPVQQLLMTGAGLGFAVVTGALLALHVAPVGTPMILTVALALLFAAPGYLILGAVSHAVGLRSFGLVFGLVAAIATGIAIGVPHATIAPFAVAIITLALAFLGLANERSGLLGGAVVVLLVGVATTYNQSAALLFSVVLSGAVGLLMYRYVAPLALHGLTGALNKLMPDQVTRMVAALEAIHAVLYSCVGGLVVRFVKLYAWLSDKVGRFCAALGQKIKEVRESMLDSLDRLTGNRHKERNGHDQPTQPEKKAD